jgi:hypothetical protein
VFLLGNSLFDAADKAAPPAPAQVELAAPAEAAAAV